ncbi:unnamed protein product [Pleuronectes platessa]|uniref:Fanconi-associated nuclease n=1 Tax=Pleuronectes platessa TaxID=8262 RepID=A0A9N7UFE9_PLEPL|nr:unnamed protein product [Pleuronectes platessa]
MTDRANKDKPRRSLSLSKSKKKGNVSAGTPASAASSMTPITSFFNSQPPSKLACPLCGQLVPRFRINEHIDLQCQNFDRGDSSATSASNNVVPSTQLSPRRNPAKSPELDRNKEEEVKETNTSPYFKKDDLQQAPREINSKTVVRTIDLGSLSAKISKKCHDPPERTRTEGEQLEKEKDPPETLGSSQKENFLKFAEQTISDQAVKSLHPPDLPYYLRNFRTVLEAVLENEDDRALFNQDDMSLIHAFERLSVMGQKLYVRLFQRKLKWLQVNKLDYEQICSDLGPVAEELVQSGFLQSENDLEDLGEALDLLPAPELKVLAKSFHLGSSGTQKQQLVDGLLNRSKQKSIFSMSPAQNIKAVILKKANSSQVPVCACVVILALFSPASFCSSL